MNYNPAHLDDREMLELIALGLVPYLEQVLAGEENPFPYPEARLRGFNQLCLACALRDVARASRPKSIPEFVAQWGSLPLLEWPPQFSEAWQFSEGLALVKMGYKWGYVDSLGQVAIQFKFDWAESFDQGRARVKIGKKYGYIDSSGQVVGQLQFDLAERFSEELTAVKIDGKWGYIDKAGLFVIKPQFDLAGSFFQGRAKVKVGRRQHYIDLKGRFIN